VIRRGEPWGRPASGPPDLEIRGDDRALAAGVAAAPGALIRYQPASGSDVARAVGLHPGSSPAGTELSMDAIELAGGGIALNMVILGAPPDRLTRLRRSFAARIRVDDADLFDGTAATVLIAVGQWLRGRDVVPRGHPGDGRAELQVYRLKRSERRNMRRRLTEGSHLPHPRILARSARSVEIDARSPMPVEIDGERARAVTRLAVQIRPDAYRLLV
jgi:YegS C-terminal NAD kinase beta sandwich-like domain